MIVQKCPYSELFWSAFSCIRTEYGEMLHISPYSVRIRENVDQNNSEYKHFLRSALFLLLYEKVKIVKFWSYYDTISLSRLLQYVYKFITFVRSQ